MDNVINLHQQKNKSSDLKADFKIPLNTPLNLDFLQAQEPEPEIEPERKQPSVFFRMRWKLKQLKGSAFNVMIRPVRDYVYRKAGNKLLGELTTLAMTLNRPDFHVFVDVPGHVGGVRVRVFPGGWKEKADPISVLDDYLPGRKEYGKMRPKDLREAMNMMRSLSKLNRLYRR